MSCDNLPNILTNNCQLQDCSDIEVDINEFQSNGIAHDVCPAKYRVQRLLGTVKLQKCIVADTTIPEGFADIKFISKKVILNQTKIVFGQLIVEGYILKNISYVTPQPTSTGDPIDTGTCIAYRNTPKDIEVKVPFSITWGLKPEIAGLDLDADDAKSTREYSLLCNTMEGQCCDKGFMGESTCEVLRVDRATLNKLPFAELRKYRIKELDINKQPCRICTNPPRPVQECPCTPPLYNRLTEKLLLNLELDIFVEEFITIPPCPHPAPSCPVCPPSGKC